MANLVTDLSVLDLSLVIPVYNEEENLRPLAAEDNHIVAIRFRRNYGQTAAFAAGFDHARGRVIVTLDADRQNDPADIPTLLAELDKGYDVVNGWRENRQDDLVRRFPSRVANRLIARTSGVRLKDRGCSLRAFRAEVVRDLHLYLSLIHISEPTRPY